MNHSFENIFEKYNITCSIPKKRHKAAKNTNGVYSFSRNTHNELVNSNITKNESSYKNVLELNKSTSPKDFSFCYNIKTLGKYNFIPRYNTLELIPAGKERNTDFSSTNESLLRNKNILPCSSINGKENCSTYNVFSGINAERNNLTESGVFSSTNQNFSKIINCCENTEDNISAAVKNTRNSRLSSTFNFGKHKQCRVQKQQLRFKKLSITVVSKNRTENQTNINNLSKAFDSLNVPFQPSINSNVQHFEIVNTPIKTAAQNHDDGSKELDLLIDLLEQDEKNKYNCNVSNCNDILPASKSVLKGGYEELFERALKNEMVKGNFLKHDKKYGLRVGKLLTVIKLETSYGFTIAIVKSKDMRKNIAIAVTQEMVPQLQKGTQIEAFFDEKSIPYKLQIDDSLDVYLEPYKLLVV